MKWGTFAASAPALAAAGRERLERTGLVMLGTLRRDGSPRVTPIEYFIFEGEFTLSGMWRSVKLLDLLRDPRCAVHSTTSAKDGTEGDFKLYGRALPVDDEATRERWGVALLAATGWRPTGRFHLFRLDITAAAFVQFGAEARALAERLRVDSTTAVRVLPAAPSADTDTYVVASWQASEG
ncbi:MAG: pyridoxamine 5'-phosphate oxidase family protein [Dehalococcoidia bacterium]